MLKKPAPAIKIYNTLTRSLQELTAPNHKLNIFVCGPTVYDFPHLGHAKTYTQFDCWVKYLRAQNYDVNYLQNITDIDDKIIRRAEENKETWQELTARFEKIYKEDMAALGIDSVTTYARATDYISEIVAQVQKLLAAGFAYKIDDGIYFEIARFADYGRLSGRTDLEQNDAVSRIDTSEQKRGWNDFCLWKFSKPGEPVWETALGAGRPGWHIEDTAITEHFFGPQYDIHGGAIDLIFPHHEAEIAQMESASGKKPLVRYWMHTGFLNIDSKKMSKSLGNFKTIRETLETYEARVLRYLFVSAHYRTPLDFTPQILEQAQSTVKRLDEFVFACDPNLDDAENKKALDELEKNIAMALANDFNTPQAFAALFEFIRAQNTAGRTGGKNLLKFLRTINSWFGVFKFESEITDEKILALIKERDALRAAKKFAEADTVRTELEVLGVKIYDTIDGPRYRI